MVRSTPPGFPASSATGDAMAALREPGPSARDRILAASVDLLASLTPAQLLTAVGTRTIARHAGVSPALVFHHFGSVEVLADAVLHRVFDFRTVPVAEVNSTIEAVVAATLPVDAALALHHNEFDRVSKDPELRLRLGLWALSGDVGDKAYGRYMAEIDSRLEPLLAQLLRGWGRELRPPWTPASYIAAHSSLLVGSVTRHLVDPHRSDIDTFARAAASMSMISMRVRGDRHTVDDRLSEINYYPLHEGRRPITSTAGRKQAIMLHIAAEQFGIRGYSATKMSQIARAAKISESTLYSHFASKAALAAELFDKQAADALVRIGDGVDTAADATLERHLTLIATFVATHADLAPPYLSVLVDPLTTPCSTMIVDSVSSALCRTRPPGDEDDDRATLLVIATIRHALRRPARPPSDVARQSLLLLGSDHS